MTTTNLPIGPTLQFGKLILGDAVKIIFAATTLPPIVKAIHLQIIADYYCSFWGSHIGDSIPSCDMDYSYVQ